MTTSPSPETYGGGPSRDELAAARQVVDLFASEALLALDRYERSFPKSETDSARQVGDRLAYWWQKLELDDVRPDPRGSDAEQILSAAGGLSVDPENKWGVSIEYASAYANNLAVVDGRTMPTTTIDDLRARFDQAYGGQASVPGRADDWLAQSLTRFARSSALRDVLAEGARVEASEPLRAAADELVRQGQRLMDDRRGLAVQRETPAKRSFGVNARNFAGYWAYGTALSLTGAPFWAQVAMNTPATAMLLHSWYEQHEQRKHRLDPAQAQLRSVRTDLIKNLDEAGAVTQRSTRAVRGAGRPTDHGR
jgi:hypothetical protein